MSLRGSLRSSVNSHSEFDRLLYRGTRTAGDVRRFQLVRRLVLVKEARGCPFGGRWRSSECVLTHDNLPECETRSAETNCPGHY